MSIKRIAGMVVVALLTFLSISTILYIKDRDYGVSEGYSDYSQDIYEYTGFIFDDYNKKVNLEYKDEIQEDVNNNDDLDAISQSALEMEYTPDNMRRIRSESIIDERAVMDAEGHQNVEDSKE